MEPGDAPPFPNLPSVVPSTSEKPLPNPLAPAQPNSPFLPLFNQTASQRGVAVEYAANLIEGQWVVQCVVNGIPKGNQQQSWKFRGVPLNLHIPGTASGSTKKIAQEGAAREAYHAMGWV
ncbi:hypothetical protein FB451DRAFT_550434 [Mycena latifolia]|nr:hypothetical protein FB451DRAFT_550434 [Mycena latifolia]